MFKSKINRLNAIFGKYPLPQKIHRDLLIMASFDIIFVCEANTYEVKLGRECARISVVGSGPMNCHKILIVPGRNNVGR